MTNCEDSVHVIRVAIESDAPEIARLLTMLGHPATAEDVAARWEAFHAQGNHAFVAEHPDGGLAGVLTVHEMRVLHRPKAVGRISTLVIDERVRGQGIGRPLVAAAEAALAEAGCGLVEVTSNLCREDAHAFYSHLGYEQTSARFAKVFSPTG